MKICSAGVEAGGNRRGVGLMGGFYWLRDGRRGCRGCGEVEVVVLDQLAQRAGVLLLKC